ncbi:MAG: membrane protein insertase YidC [Candidatus Moraniibacteriota bacterium]|nr:MAG: membrane protein insertase YidC [Candidatus Moranbacteria bacterium]
MSALFHSLVYQPIYNLLVFLYDFVPGGDFGIAIILVTILLKTALFPLSQKQIESQKKMQDIQPKLKDIQRKHKDNREKQSRAIMEFYRENKVNPLSGCLPIIIQLIILIAIYRVLFNISQADFKASSDVLYSFIKNPGDIGRFFLGILDLSKPSIFLAVTTALAQYYQMKMVMANKESEKPKTLKTKPDQKESTSPAEPDFSEIMMKQMLYIGPALTLFFGMTFPSGLALYWLASTLFMIAQQWYLLKKTPVSTRLPAAS